MSKFPGAASTACWGVALPGPPLGNTGALLEAGTRSFHECPSSCSRTGVCNTRLRAMTRFLGQLSHPLLAPLLLPSIFPTIRVFSSDSALHITWPKYWKFSINPSNEYSGLIFFRIDWFDLLAVQETLESSLTPQFKNISSLALSLPYGPALPSVHDYWKNHSFDYMDLCWQRDVFPF